MTTMVNRCGPVASGAARGLRAKIDTFLNLWKRRCAALESAWIDHHFSRQRAARERFLSRARDHYELERLERALDRGEGEIWRVY